VKRRNAGEPRASLDPMPPSRNSVEAYIEFVGRAARRVGWADGWRGALGRIFIWALLLSFAAALVIGIINMVTGP
jgi:hypothetical protein